MHQIIKFGMIIQRRSICHSEVKQKDLSNKSLPFEIDSSSLPQDNTAWPRCSCPEVGFILLIVMIFLLIFSALSIYGLTRATATLEILQQTRQVQMATVQANKILQYLEQISLEACEIPTIPTYVLVNKPISWWEEVLCSGEKNHLKYYYVMENLDSIICAKYQRITLFALPVLTKDVTILLQSTVIKPTCIGQDPIMKLGRQRLRILKGMI